METVAVVKYGGKKKGLTDHLTDLQKKKTSITLSFWGYIV